MRRVVIVLALIGLSATSCGGDEPPPKKVWDCNCSLTCDGTDQPHPVAFCAAGSGDKAQDATNNAAAQSCIQAALGTCQQTECVCICTPTTKTCE